MAYLTLKGIIGGLVVIAISLISKSKNYYLAGFLPLFPTFSIFAHYAIGSTRPAAELKETCLFGAFSCLTLVAYLLSVYALAGKMSIIPNILLSLVVWAIASAILLVLWNKF